MAAGDDEKSRLSVRSVPVFLPPVIGRNAEDVFEGTGKMQLVGIAALFADLVYGQI